MNWTIINKSETERPVSVTDYSDFKPYLRREAAERCVYCAINENPIGGYDHFHVEHFRPKSLSQFNHLLNDFENLFYACAICNRFKSNDWPNDPVLDHSIISYPDPKDVDYNTLFFCQENGILGGNFVASKYMVEKLNLNRPQLINERREKLMRDKIAILISSIQKMKLVIQDLEFSPEIAKITSILFDKILEITSLLNEEKEIARYEPSEIRRLN